MAKPHERRTGDWTLLRRFLHWTRPTRWQLITSIALIPLVVVCGIAQPRILGVAIDEYMLQGDLDGLAGAAILFFVVVVFEYIIGGAQIYLITACGVRSVNGLRRDVYRHVMRQGQRFFDRRPIGSLLSRTTTDIEAVGEALATGVVGILTDLVRLVGIISYMFSLDWMLTLVAFGVMPIVAIVVHLARAKLRDLSTWIRIYTARMNGYMQDQLAGVEVVQLMGGEESSVREFDDLNRKNVHAVHWANFYDAMLYAVMDGVSSICIAAVVWYGGARVLMGGLTPGMLVAFVEYIQKALIPVKEFSGKYATLQRTMAALERVFGLLDTHEEVHAGDDLIAQPRGHIRFEDVTYRYPQTDHDVLHNVSFEVKPGSVVALVGSTGAGKSTICRLLTQAYDGYQGSITVDGIEVRDLAPSQLSKLVAVVHQDVFLFQGTIRFNATLGDPSITDDRLAQALDIAEARGLVDAFPGGLEAMLVERGRNLSAGQGQLLTLTRAVSRMSDVVVLDEATASVDPITEALIQNGIGRILASKTVLVVAHRLSTVRAADTIIVLENGQIMESGTHMELLQEKGRYAALHETQRAFEGILLK